MPMPGSRLSYLVGGVVRRVLGFLVVTFCIVAAFLAEIPSLVDQHMNKVLVRPPYSAPDKAFALHSDLTIADLHADSLLWGRDLLDRDTVGHIDIPRLADGNVALQVFSLPTKTPRGLN